MMHAEEARRQKRFTVHLPARLFVIMPEETFQPKEKRSALQNVSLSGLKILTEDVDETFYKNLLKTVRYAKVSFTPSGAKTEISLHGRIVWINYFSEQRYLELGIFFEQMIAPEQKTLHDMIDRLETGSAPAKGAPPSG